MSGTVARLAVHFAAGLLFAVGLGISGMTQPTKVVGFLDVFGAWDPSLAFVMVGGRFPWKQVRAISVLRLSFEPKT